MSGLHARLWGPAAIQKDLGTRSKAGRYQVPHAHKWERVATFTERGFALFVCADKACGETRTLWQSEIEVLQILEAHEWGQTR